MIVGTFLFGLAALSALLLAGFSLVDREFSTAAIMPLFAAGLAWGAWACRLDWRRENQKRENSSR